MQPSSMSTTPPTVRRDDELETEPGSRTIAERPSTEGTAANCLTVRRFSGVMNDIPDEPTVWRDSSWEVRATEFRAEDVGHHYGVIDHDEHTRANKRKCLSGNCGNGVHEGDGL